MVTEAEKLAARAALRCQGYWLLSRLFLEPPSEDFLKELQKALASAEGDSGDLQADIDCLQAGIQDALQDPEATAVEFTRRLVAVPKNSGEALPIESHFLRPRFQESVRTSLHRRLDSWGYGPVLALSSPPDHLGAELRLMAWLCNDEREAWQREDTEAAVEELRRQAELMFDHVAKWVPDYCRSLASATENAYLQAVARITMGTLKSELALLDGLCSQVDIVPRN